MSNLAIKTTETDQAYAQLHRAIVRGELSPNERLVEMELAQKLGVGRAAVRAALARLEQAGLVEHEPNRGARVRAVSEEEATEMLEVRAVLEGLAARYAARKITDQGLVMLQAIHAQMQACLEQDDLLSISNLNAQWHDKLLAIANHQTITNLIHRLRAQHVRFQYRTLLVPGRARHSLAEHEAVMVAVAAHDEAAAENAMRQHLTSTADALREGGKISNPAGHSWR
ncbi:MAG: GntR family transcriptional regulator [Chloroflexi bacterium]|nr:GntR family transcriptional regulator [Chloroflexota bacterium]